MLFQHLLSGVAVGGLYALIAVGFVTIYNVTGIINFAQGEFAMVAAMTAATMASAGGSLAVALAVGVAAATLVGLLVQRVALYPARRSPEVVLIIITIGASIAVRGIALAVWKSEPRSLPAFSEGGPLALGPAVISRQDVWVLGIALVAMVALFGFFERSTVGAALRACAMNREVSRLMGIAPDRMNLLAFGLSAALAGVAGVAIAPGMLATYDMGLMLGLKGFVAAVLGGLGSPLGAVIGGFLIGMLEQVAAGMVSSGYKDALAFIVLLFVLLFRPAGLLARTAGRP